MIDSRSCRRCAAGKRKQQRLGFAPVYSGLLVATNLREQRSKMSQGCGVMRLALNGLLRQTEGRFVVAGRCDVAGPLDERGPIHCAEACE